VRTILIALALGICAQAGLAAQTPAGSQAASAIAPTSGKPLRHLEYSFTDDYEGVSEYHFNGIGNGIETSSGVGDVGSSIGGRGTMFADVVAVAQDGALRIKIYEWVQGEAHPGDTYTCAVYGSTAVVCPHVPAPSDAEWVLLSYLGRQFVDGAPWDAQHHWQRKADTPAYRLVEDFALDDGSDDKRAIVRETKKISLHNGEFGTQTEDIKITYDRTMEVPDAIHDEVQSIGSAGSGHGSYDFKLISDSFAKAPN
jgi:hypothetical protein